MHSDRERFHSSDEWRRPQSPNGRVREDRIIGHGAYLFPKTGKQLAGGVVGSSTDFGTGPSETTSFGSPVQPSSAAARAASTPAAYRG
jgi:hypothetical protein